MIENGAGKIPGLLTVLALVPDPRKFRGRRYPLVFVLAVAAACTPAGAKTIHAVDAGILDEITGNWLRDLAEAGHLEDLLTAIAIDGKWLRGVASGQVKLFAAMLHDEKTVIAGHDPRRDHRDHPGQGAAGRRGPGRRRGHRRRRSRAKGHRRLHRRPRRRRRRESAYLLTVKGNQPTLQRDLAAAIGKDWPRNPDFTELGESHGRMIRRSLWVVDASGIDFPHASQAARIRRDRYDRDGTLISRETVHAITSLTREQPRPAARPRGQAEQAARGPAPQDHGRRAARVRPPARRPFPRTLNPPRQPYQPGPPAAPRSGSDPSQSPARSPAPNSPDSATAQREG
jgi:hypothetical protein